MFLEKFIFGRTVRELYAGCGYVGLQTTHPLMPLSQIYIHQLHRVRVQIAFSALEKKLNFLRIDDKGDTGILSDSDEFEDDV